MSDFGLRLFLQTKVLSKLDFTHSVLGMCIIIVVIGRDIYTPSW